MTAPALSWRHAAACHDADLHVFFGPDLEHPADQADREAKALKVCAGCPVVTDCRAWHLSFPSQHGVAGGMGEDDRRTMRHSLIRRYPDGQFPALAVMRAVTARGHLKVCAGPCGRALAADQFPKRGGGHRRATCKACWGDT